MCLTSLPTLPSPAAATISTCKVGREELYYLPYTTRPAKVIYKHLTQVDWLAPEGGDGGWGDSRCRPWFGALRGNNPGDGWRGREPWETDRYLIVGKVRSVQLGM